MNAALNMRVVATEPLELSKIDNEGYELEDVSVRDEDEE